MNVEELIEKIEALPAENYKYRPYIDKKVVLALVRQLDEPQKVTIPQFVADWIEEVKPAYTLFAAMEYGNLKIDKWLDNNSNQETFALAWIFGYEVEKEKRYLVKVKGVEGYGRYLNKVSSSKTYCFASENENYGYITKHTRKELEEANFGWVFDCEGVEIEEVE